MLLRRSILYHHVIDVLHDFLKKGCRDARTKNIKRGGVLKFVNRIQSDEVGDALILDI